MAEEEILQREFWRRKKKRRKLAYQMGKLGERSKITQSRLSHYKLLECAQDRVKDM